MSSIETRVGFMRYRLVLLGTLLVLSTSASAIPIRYEFAGTSLQDVLIGGSYSVLTGAPISGGFLFDPDAFLVPAEGTSDDYGTGGAHTPRGPATGIDLTLSFEIVLPTGEKHMATMAQSASSRFGITIDNGASPNGPDSIAMKLAQLQLSETPLASNEARFGLALTDNDGDTALTKPGAATDLSLSKFDGHDLLLELPVGLGSNAEVLGVFFSLDRLQQAPAVAVPEPSLLTLLAVAVLGLAILMVPQGIGMLRGAARS